MKHVHAISVVKATDDTTLDQVESVLDQVFSFIIDLVNTKGKTDNTTA